MKKFWMHPITFATAVLLAAWLVGQATCFYAGVCALPLVWMGLCKLEKYVKDLELRASQTVQ